MLVNNAMKIQLREIKFHVFEVINKSVYSIIHVSLRAYKQKAGV